ncbi:MAG: hypothetical protein LW809_01870 [Vampirovibrionales bacterium]|jgi:hypothetical protein|nr:hypothetical protein [Vampirovibrionales bacterium]
MKRHVFLLASLVILAPSLAQADYTNLPQSGIERLPHFTQQHYIPKAKVVIPSLPEEQDIPSYIDTEEEDASTKAVPCKSSKVVERSPVVPQVNASVNPEGYVEIPYTTGDGVIRIETNAVEVAPTIYGYSEDGLPITDFSNKVNHYKAQFIQQNPHLFKAKKP